MDILGIRAFSGPASAALVRDGRVFAAAREEHFTRRAGDASFPRNAVAYCLRAGKIGPSALESVAWFGRPRPAFERALARGLARGPAGYSFFRRALIEGSGPEIESREWITRELDGSLAVRPVEAAIAEAAGAYFASPFPSAAVLAAARGDDGVAALLARGEGAALESVRELASESSLETALDAFARIAGREVLDAAIAEEREGHVLDAREADVARAIASDLFGENADGSFAPRAEYFEAGATSSLQTWARETRLEGAALARAAVAAAGIVAAGLARAAGPSNALVVAGLAARPALRAAIRAALPNATVWSHPAAGAGLEAAGAALVVAARGGAPPVRAKEDAAPRSTWAVGPGYNSHQIRTFLRSRELAPEELDEGAIVARAADLLARGGRVGWFQGRLDLGAAPIGSRAVLSRVQFAGSPLQVSRTEHRALHDLLAAWDAGEHASKGTLTARPLALDGGPVACAPEDAFDCFLRLDLDAIALGPYFVTREMIGARADVAGFAKFGAPSSARAIGARS